MTPQTPNLRSLLALARREDLDIRPTLLRVLTDLFVQQPTQTDREIARYSELALRLIECADAETRIAVANRLADCKNAPRGLLLKLAADTIAVATPVLRHGAFGEKDLVRLYDMLGSEHRQVIALRRDLPFALAGRLGELTRNAAQAFATQRATRAVTDIARPASIAREDRPVPARSTERADSDIAARIDAARERAAAKREPHGTSTQTAALPNRASPPLAPSVPRLSPLPAIAGSIDLAATLRALEQSALEGRPHLFAEWLQRTFGFTAQTADRIVADPTGEEVAVVCKALDMPNDTFSRVILFLDPKIGRSVVKVFALAEYFGCLSVASARARCTAWRDAERAPALRHQPATAPDGSGRHRPTEQRRTPMPLAGAARTAR